MSLLWFIIIGVIAGWISSVIVRGQGMGIIGDLVIGVVGAVIGGFIFDFLGFTAYGTVGTLAMSVVGAVALLGIVGMMKRV